MISWRARDAYWIPDPLERGDIDHELNNRVWHKNWGVSLEIEQLTEDLPRVYGWEYTCATAGDTRVFEHAHPMSENHMLSNFCADRSIVGWAWGFTFVRIDP